MKVFSDLQNRFLRNIQQGIKIFILLVYIKLNNDIDFLVWKNNKNLITVMELLVLTTIKFIYELVF